MSLSMTHIKTHSVYNSRSTFFFFNDTATTEIYTLSLHDALPISPARRPPSSWVLLGRRYGPTNTAASRCSSTDRKSTRLNSSHLVISYAVFCLKKKQHSSVLEHRHAASINTSSRAAHYSISILLD